MEGRRTKKEGDWRANSDLLKRMRRDLRDYETICIKEAISDS
jgi:hypothetical protein